MAEPPVRDLYVDEGPGETRAVVTLRGLPERLLLHRTLGGETPEPQRLGAVVAGRVASVDRRLGLAYVELGAGPAGVLQLKPDQRLPQGALAAVQVRAEAHGDKGPSLRLLGEETGAVRLLEPAPSFWETLERLVDAEPIRGREAREAADAAQEAALAVVHPLPTAGDIAVEPTRALVAIDVDLGGGHGGDSKRATRHANLEAVHTAARVLRLKGLGGLAVLDLAGRGHDGAAILQAARTAFAPDQPGVGIGPVSKFGTVELALPRRGRSVLEQLTDGGDGPSVETQALDLLRMLERAAQADRAGRLAAHAPAAVVAAAAPALPQLHARYGGRLSLAAAGEGVRPYIAPA